MALTYFHITGLEPVANFLADHLRKPLGLNQSVLWLVPGGSALALVKLTLDKLEPSELANLSLSLTDERFGPVGHADSNWQQLIDSGAPLDKIHGLPVLTGQDMDATTKAYAETLQAAFAKSDYALGLFGMGPDGHTVGILPGSPAITATGLTASYDAGNFKRITMTPSAIARLNEAVLYAVGADKYPVLDKLAEKVPLNDQPAQALKQVPELTIFSDYKGEQL